MPTIVRPATSGDLAAISALLLQDAAERAASDGDLWPLASDASQRVAKTLSVEMRNEGSNRWLVAEVAGAVEGVARLGVIPCPPIYHLAGKRVFLLYDDTIVSSSAPNGALALLVAAAEREGAALGAISYLAACAPFQRDKRRMLESLGYGVVTDYLVKHSLSSGASPAGVRAAVATDVPAIVEMGAQSQEALFQANAQMWKPHPEARARFGAWMHFALTLPDRCILVHGGHDGAGFVIAQPASAFHLPLTCDRERIGLIDDFWAQDFATAKEPQGATHAGDLLKAAELEFVARGRTSAMAICPAGWRSKQDFLRAHGYRVGNTWMLKA